MSGMRIGIDLGGTKIEGIALADDGTERLRRRILRRAATTTRRRRRSSDFVRAIEQEVGVRGSVGVGIPGAVSPATRLIKNANSTWLNGRPLAEDLARLLDRPVRLANDANCFALSEATDGAAAGADVVFGVIVGTGTGGGIVVARPGVDRRERDRRRVGAQPAALRRAGDESSRPDVLLRSARLHRRRFCRAPASRATTGKAADVTAKEIAVRAAGGEALA